MKLSINLNKIALIRNSRGEDYPNLEQFADLAISLGVDGLTLHPRPDHRHATSNDVIHLSSLTKNKNVEFNLEGNPFSKANNSFYGFCELVEKIKPDQITLVPDTINQITSDHGWTRGEHDNELKDKIAYLKSISELSKISLFIDNIDGVHYAHELSVDCIEIHTGEFAKAIALKEIAILDKIKAIVMAAKEKNILVNAGHDLNLNNLPYLIEIGGINEVSIGHAIIVDSLKYGFKNTVIKYINAIGG